MIIYHTVIKLNLISGVSMTKCILMKIYLEFSFNQHMVSLQENHSII